MAKDPRWDEFRKLNGPRPGGRGAQERWDKEWESFKADWPMHVWNLRDALLEYGRENAVPEDRVHNFMEACFEIIDTGPLEQYAPCED